MITGRRVSVTVARKTPLMFHETAVLVTYRPPRVIKRRNPSVKKGLFASTTHGQRIKKKKKKEPVERTGRFPWYLKKLEAEELLLAVRICKYLFRTSNQRERGSVTSSLDVPRPISLHTMPSIIIYTQIYTLYYLFLLSRFLFFSLRLRIRLYLD